ncbi:MAG TPA: F0F1 ATP synthase subunit epsilon [Pseudonocardiaceae bacterium]|nr:F0F1 ATP synthase subunit epsilon [Pseudonocardiaceae bacterium]
MAEMTVELVAVEGRLWSGQASAVFTRTTVGEIGILPRHIPLLGELIGDCVVRIDGTDGKQTFAAVQGGFLSVTGERVSILAETAELGTDIDVAKARTDLTDDDEVIRARATARLRAAGQAA